MLSDAAPMDYHEVEVVWRSSEVTEIEDLDQGFLQSYSMSFCVLFLSVNPIKTRYAKELLSISPDFPCILLYKGQFWVCRTLPIGRVF